MAGRERRVDGGDFRERAERVGGWCFCRGAAARGFDGRGHERFGVFVVERIEAAGESEVERFGLELGSDQDVRRLEVAVDDAARVRGGESGGDVAGQLHSFAEVESRRKGFVERPAVDIFHRDDRQTIVFFHGVDRADVGMVERRGGACLAQHRAARGGAGSFEHFEGDSAFEPEVAGGEDAAERAVANPFLDAVVAQHAAGSQRSFQVDRAIRASPVRGAQAAALESIEHSQDFIHIATDRQVVDDGVLHELIAIDEEQAARRHFSFGHPHAKGMRDLAVDVGGERKTERADASLGWRRSEPFAVRVERVGADPQQVAVAFGEVVDALAKTR